MHMTEKKKQLFGTNGVRGIVGELITPELVMKIGMAVGSMRPGTIAVGMDTRTSGPALINAMKAGLMATGCNVIDCGILPTPALQYIVMNRYDAGVVITASHNPGAYNGVKVIEKDGTEMDDEASIEIEERVFSYNFDLKEWKDVGVVIPEGDLVSKYIAGVVKKVPEKIGEGIMVAIDPGCGAAYRTTAEILQSIGCKIFTLNAYPDGNFPARDPEPSIEGLAPLAEMVVSTGAAFGVAHDGDADRAVFIDDKGRFVEENKEFALIAEYICSQKKGILVTPVSTSRLIETVIAPHGCTVDYTAVGSIYVARRMRALIAEGKPVAFGGEGNGGLIYPDHQFCRDGGMTAAMMVLLLATKKQPLSTLVDSLPPSIMLKHKFHTDKASEILTAVREKFSRDSLNQVDGIRIDRKDAWALIRPSGTEPLVRLYVESTDESIAKGFEKEILSCISNFI
ncbi:phosphoglucomutase/phosphomannomutase alpha/beta/alpha domain I [Methanospirillum hungatei JF-1]|uniref:Phosphoglucomutase/phosphomannomutase alpha/beta/alpha domain I n=1 Tax=Methanospirillum hungatei JF-1 (strain ATCC 27890 / DSM 864 / NBRC 100397 / JF-1) TaxID=323259 RepID=Q2FPW5_METHJ|nr:phosphoglucomutase/phosphomannomutase alpha/beta/alpha domain I [Methanospirillum hungatei JF-1]